MARAETYGPEMAGYRYAWRGLYFHDAWCAFFSDAHRLGEGKAMSLKRVDTGASKPSESPQAIVVMGVAGCGKSSVACLIAKRFGGVLIEGDSFHSQECIQKMRDGIPLTDIDRAAWLAQLNEALLRAVAADELPVLACSALKARYRDILGTSPLYGTNLPTSSHRDPGEMSYLSMRHCHSRKSSPNWNHGGDRALPYR